MLGIEQIGVAVPHERIDNLAQGRRLDADEAFLREKLGFMNLARKPREEQCSDLCVEAFRNLQSRQAVDPETIQCVVVITQNPDGHGLPHASAITHQKLGLPSSACCFDVSLGCTGFVHGLSIAQSFMQSHGMTRGLLFTADPYSRVIDENDRNTVLLFGDAAACTLISDQPRFRAGRFAFDTDSESHRAIYVNESRSLRMDGNRVFRYVAKRVPPKIHECLRLNDRALGDVDLILLHQGSRYIVETLIAAMDLPRAKTPFQAGETGNTVSSSIPLMLQDTLDEDQEVRSVLTVGFGVGLSSCVTLLDRIPS